MANYNSFTMPREQLTSGDKSISISVTPLEERERSGFRMTVNSVPPTEIIVFPEEVTVTHGAFNINFSGDPQILTGDNGMRIESRNDGIAQLSIHDEGKIVFSYTPNPLPPSEIPIIPVLPKSGKRNYKERFAGVNPEDPSTFDPLTFGQTVQYFRVSEGWTQKELAERADYSQTSIIRIEGRPLAQSKSTLLRVLNGFGWEEDDPRRRIVVDKFEQQKR